MKSDVNINVNVTSPQVHTPTQGWLRRAKYDDSKYKYECQICGAKFEQKRDDCSNCIRKDPSNTGTVKVCSPHRCPCCQKKYQRIKNKKNPCENCKDKYEVQLVYTKTILGILWYIIMWLYWRIVLHKQKILGTILQIIATAFFTALVTLMFLNK